MRKRGAFTPYLMKKKLHAIIAIQQHTNIQALSKIHFFPIEPIEFQKIAHMTKTLSTICICDNKSDIILVSNKNVKQRLAWPKIAKSCNLSRQHLFWTQIRARIFKLLELFWKKVFFCRCSVKGFHSHCLGGVPDNVSHNVLLYLCEIVDAK